MNTMIKTRHLIKTLFVLCFLLFAIASVCHADSFDLVLQWDENTEPDLATGDSPRYKIYYKTGTSGAGVKSNYIGQPAGEPEVADEGDSPVGVTVALDENPDPTIVQLTLHNLEDSQDYYFAVTALDLAGNESDLSNEVVYEGVVAPVNQAPMVSSLTVNGVSGSNTLYTNHSTGTVSVRIAASDTDGTINQYLILANDSNPLNGTFVNTPAGALAAQDFTVNFNLPANGTHTLYAWVKDDDGDISALASKSNVVLDRTLPVAPTAMDLNVADDTGVSSTDNITNSTSGLTINGSGEEGATVQLYNGATAIGTPATVSSGSFTRDISLTHGTHSITARQTDRAGNVSSASTALTIIVDTARPTGSLAYSPTDTAHVNVGAFTLTGAFSENLGQTPQITITGSGSLAMATAQAMTGSGSVWTKTLSVPSNDSATYTVAISGIADVAGNTSSSNIAGSFTTDTLDTDGDGTRDYTDTDDDNDGMPDTWETQYGLNPKNNDASLDPDGDGVSNLNEYLNQSNPANRAPVVGALTVNSVAGGAYVYTNHATGAVSVRIIASDTNGTVDQYLIQDNNSTRTGTFVAIPGGSKASQDFAVSFALTGDGNHTLYVWVKDNGGDISAVASKSNVILDRTGPTAPVMIDLQPADDTGISSTDNITSKTTGLTVSGSADEGSTVQLYDGSNPVGNSLTATSGAFSTDLSLTQGSHVITYTHTDLSGNVSSKSVALTITVDATRPTGILTYSPTDASHVNTGAFIITGTFSENLSLTPQITITGGGPIAITTPQAMTGSGSVWTKTVNIPVNDNTAYSISVTNIADVAGNTATGNLAGNFVTDTVDTDGDAIRDYTDTDDDNDGMPDAWEVQYGLNPKANDSALDGDGDGITNLNEYLTQTNPTLPDANVKPNMPALVSPENDEVVDLSPELIISEFSDNDAGDVHTETEWQIYLEIEGAGEKVYELKTASALTSLTAPSMVLDANTDYVWRARVFDDHGAASEWSEYGYFTTGQDPADVDGDGIVDEQVPDPSTDIDQDGTVDTEQLNIKSIRVKGKASLIGMDTSDSPKVVKIVYLQSTDPLDQTKYPGMASLPGSMPYGLLDFKIKVQKAGDSAELVIYFSETLPDNASWYKYDSVENTWSDFSANVTISPNKNSMTLILQDGGAGDSDGLANGMIVDPSGLVAPSSQDDDDDSETPSTSSASGGGGGGCFIQSVQPGSANAFNPLIKLVLIAGILMLIQSWRRNKTSEKKL